jgi:predicted phosphodiesterase
MKISKKVLVWADSHAPEQDDVATRCAIKLGKFYKPDLILSLGDVGEYGSVSHFSKGKPKLLEGMRIKDDVESAVSYLNLMATINPRAEKVCLMGNHEERVNTYLQENPQAEGLVSVATEYNKAGWKTVDMNIPYEVCHKLIAIHGVSWGKYASAAHLQMYSKSIIFAHIHKTQSFSHAFYDGVKMSWACPCLSNLNPNYLRNKPSAYIHGLMLIDILEDGRFFPDVVLIIDGVTSRFGTVFDGHTK